MAGLLFGGCRPVPLHSVPIEGGTSEQRDVIAEELARFATDADAAWLRLSWVRIAWNEETYGTYYPDRKAIRLDSTLHGAHLQLVTRHELCHALDFQGGQLSKEVPGLRAVFEERFPERLHRWRMRRRQEAFAELCALGPDGLRVIHRSGCDTFGADRFVGPVLDLTYGAVDAAEARPVASGWPTVTALAGYADHVRVDHADGTSTLVDLVRGGVASADTNTGEPTAVEDDVPVFRQLSPLDRQTDGDVAIVGAKAVFDDSSFFAVHASQDTWRGVGGCAEDGSVAITGRGAVFAQREGDTYTLYRVDPPHP